MRPVPVTDGAVEADMPVKGEEQNRPIIEVCENVNDGMNHAAENEGQPPMSAGVGFVEKAPEQDGIDDESSGRVQEIMTCDPEWVIEVHLTEGFIHDF